MLFEGYASTIDVDSAGHRVFPSAFTESIAKRGISGPKGVKLLYAHKADLPLGPITKLEVRNRGLWIAGEIIEEISYAKDLILAIEAVGGLSFSVGFYPQEVDFETDDGAMEITKGELIEVSIVTLPCNAEAVMTSTKELTNLETSLALLDEMKQYART